MNAASQREEPLVFLYRLKPGMGPQYDRAHKAVWPEIVALLDEAGFYDYRIWRRGDLVVSSLRTRWGYDTRHASARRARSSGNGPPPCRTYSMKSPTRTANRCGSI